MNTFEPQLSGRSHVRLRLNERVLVPLLASVSGVIPFVTGNPRPVDACLMYNWYQIMSRV